MKKYVIAKTGEEVKFGDIIAHKYVKETSFGTFESYTEVTLTSSNVENFIKEGIIKCLEEPTIETKNVSSYVEKIAKKMNTSPDEVVKFLDKLNKVCPKAVLDVLLQTIALDFYERNPTTFNKAEEYYSLKPSDGTVGRVYSLNAYIPLFKSKEEAEYARKILAKQLDLMYGKQKSC